MSKLNKNILLIYGSGGHNEQMARIYKGLESMCQSKEDSIQFISLCDDDVKNIVTDLHYIVPTVTDKFSYAKLLVKLPSRIFKIFKICRQINRATKIRTIISTGPGISIIVSFYFKFFTKAKIIHVESWSRFYSKSLTGRFLYLFSHKFFVQNIELRKVYPKSIYKGRL